MSVSAVKNTPDEYEDDFEKDLDWLISEESKSEEQVSESMHNDVRNRFISWRQSSGIVCGIPLHRRCTCVCVKSTLTQIHTHFHSPRELCLMALHYSTHTLYVSDFSEIMLSLTCTTPFYLFFCTMPFFSFCFTQTEHLIFYNKGS